MTITIAIKAGIKSADYIKSQLMGKQNDAISDKNRYTLLKRREENVPRQFRNLVLIKKLTLAIKEAENKIRAISNQIRRLESEISKLEGVL